MAKKKEKFIETLRSKKINQLEKMLIDERNQHFEQKIKHRTGQLTGHHILSQSKIKIAQIKTVMTEKNNQEKQS
tara:strand:- start:127 stop:348 length:222 start_codon:yes stop_codon:yes gene_type:complete